jgi:hypothetical protein
VAEVDVGVEAREEVIGRGGKLAEFGEDEGDVGCSDL